MASSTKSHSHTRSMKACTSCRQVKVRINHLNSFYPVPDTDASSCVVMQPKLFLDHVLDARIPVLYVVSIRHSKELQQRGKSDVPICLSLICPYWPTGDSRLDLVTQQLDDLRKQLENVSSEIIQRPGQIIPRQQPVSQVEIEESVSAPSTSISNPIESPSPAVDIFGLNSASFNVAMTPSYYLGDVEVTAQEALNMFNL